MENEPAVANGGEVVDNQATLDANVETNNVGEGTQHPLENKWVLWYDSPKHKASNQSWEDNLKKVYTFGTVEEFWSMYNNIIPASKLSVNSNYHLFKEGIVPMWEDKRNVNGGKWTFWNQMEGARLDTKWLNIVLGLIGETMDDAGDICGVVVSVKRGRERICLWTGTAADAEKQVQIGRRMKEVLNLPGHFTIQYESHSKALTKGSSHVEAMLEV